MSWRRRLTELVAGTAFVGVLVAGVLYVRDGSTEPAALRTVTPGALSSDARGTTPSVAAAPSSAPSPTGAADTATPMRRTPRPRPPVIGDPLSSALATMTRPTVTRTPRSTRPPVSTPASTPPSTPLPPPAADFTLATFNVLGASHTASGGSKSARPSGRARARGAAELIARHGADVIGFQELQGSQLAALRRTTDLDFYPGSSLGRLNSENSIGWRRDVWAPVQVRTVRIPYFDGGRRAMPVVLLRHRRSGLEAWFTNFHNPAETARFHHQQRFRTIATDIEARLANQLIATKLPVFITGDMNERASYFCRLTARTPMLAARGGSRSGGRCQVGRPRAVDWIFGSPGVTFSGYSEDRSHLVDITTDHPVVSTHVRILGTAAVR